MKFTNWSRRHFSSRRGSLGLIVGWPEDFRNDREKDLVLESAIHRRSNASQQLHHASFVETRF
jgi:hypothetical protein